MDKGLWRITQWLASGHAHLMRQWRSARVSKGVRCKLKVKQLFNWVTWLWNDACCLKLLSTTMCTVKPCEEVYFDLPCIWESSEWGSDGSWVCGCGSWSSCGCGLMACDSSLVGVSSFLQILLECPSIDVWTLLCEKVKKEQRKVVDVHCCVVLLIKGNYWSKSQQNNIQ